MADPYKEPALKTPPGVTSRFPITHSDAARVWFDVCATLSTVVAGTLLLLRIYTRLRILRKVDMTDCLILVSLFESVTRTLTIAEISPYSLS